MIRGLYTAGAGMLVNEQKSKVIDENIENMRTPGYRGVSVSVTDFPSHLALRLDADTGRARYTELGTMGTGVYAEKLLYRDTPGLIRETGNDTDIAVNGDGYFAIQTAAGERYTRNGHFVRDPAGYLRTTGGNQVLGVDGPIGPLPEEFAVRNDGSIINSETGQEIGRLRLVDLEAASLEREGLTTLFNTTAAPREMAAGEMRIEQGFIEEANVDTAEQMVQLIKTVRCYAANQRVITSNDTLLEKTVNEIGKV